MEYSGYFYDIKDNEQYTVKIITNNDDTQKEQIILTDEPFLTEMNSEFDTLFTPLKTQVGTISMLSRWYKFDMFTTKPQGTKALLYKGDEILWTGYVEPELYDVGFDEFKEITEINIVDGLGSLKHIPYRSEDKQIRSFWYIINKVIKNCNCYTGFYVSTNLRLSESDTDSIINKIYLTELNFFEEKKDDEKDDDVAWKCDEVLEEIAKYLGMSVFSFKDKVFFVDYDAIRNNHNEYFYYNLDNDSYSRVNIGDSQVIDTSVVGCTLSMDQIYNKINVVAKLHTFDNVFPDAFNEDKLVNITSDSDTSIENRDDISQGACGEVITTPDGNMIVFVDKFNKDYNAVAVKYYDNPDYTFYRYDSNHNLKTFNKFNYTDTVDMYGALLSKISTTKLEKVIVDKFGEFLELRRKGQKPSLNDWLVANDVSSFSFDNYIELLNPSTYHIDETVSGRPTYPYFDIEVNDSTNLIGGDNTFLLISGDYIYHSFDPQAYPVPDGEIDLDEGRYYIQYGEAALMCKLQWGDYYWDGRDKWTKAESYFPLKYISDSSSINDRRADATMFKSLSIVNTVNWRYGLTERGYCIPIHVKGENTGLPDGIVLTGHPKLTVYKPTDPYWRSSKSSEEKGRYYKMNRVFLKNFSIRVAIGDPTFGDKGKDDTVYSKTPDADSINELGDIEFKINTWDGKDPNYSSVLKKNENGDFIFVDEIYNHVLKDDVFAENGRYTTRSEWLYVLKHFKQYSHTTIKLTLNPRNKYFPYGIYTVPSMNPRKFIVEIFNRDFRSNKVEIKLIEKQ